MSIIQYKFTPWKRYSTFMCCVLTALVGRHHGMSAPGVMSIEEWNGPEREKIKQQVELTLHEAVKDMVEDYLRTKLTKRAGRTGR